MNQAKRKKVSSSDFVAESSGKNSNLIEEFMEFLKENKKWWLSPIIAVLLVLGLVIVLGGSAAAPFIYTLF